MDHNYIANHFEFGQLFKFDIITFPSGVHLSIIEVLIRASIEINWPGVHYIETLTT